MTWDRTHSLGLLGGAVALAYWPGLNDPAMAPKFAILGLGITALQAPVKWTIGLELMILWLGYAIVASLWAPVTPDALQGLWHLVLLLGAFMVGQTMWSLRPLALGLCLGLGVSSALVLAQLAGWEGLPQVASPSGLFVNKNYLGEGAALALVMALAYRLWLPAALLLPSVVLTGSRAVWLGLAIAAGIELWHRSVWAALGVALLAAIATAGLALTMGLSQGLHLWTLGHRLELWGPLLSNLSWWGHGTGSFYSLFPSISWGEALAIGTRPEFPHNEMLDLLWSFGLGSAPVWMLGVWLWRRGPEGRPFLALTGVLASAAMPLHYPLTILLVGVVAGNIARQRNDDSCAQSFRGSPLHSGTQNA